MFSFPISVSSFQVRLLLGAATIFSFCVSPDTALAAPAFGPKSVESIATDSDYEKLTEESGATEAGHNVAEWDAALLENMADASESVNWTDSALCETLPEICSQEAEPEGTPIYDYPARGTGRINPAVCSIFGGDYDRLKKALAALEILRKDFSSLDVASLPELPADDLVSFGDMKARLDGCRARPGSCSPALVSALELWMQSEYWIMLETASLGGTADTFASFGDFTVLLNRLRIFVKFCNPSGVGSGSGTDRCCMCSYDKNDEAKCQADTSCTQNACYRANDGQCHSDGYIMCQEKTVRNPECKKSFITTLQELVSDKVNLPKDFDTCGSIVDYHFGHSYPGFIHNFLPTRIRACVTGAPWCSDYRHINFGCNTFSTQGSESGVNEASQFLTQLIAQYGFDNLKFICLGNQDFSYTNPLGPEFLNCTHAMIMVTCNGGDTRTDVSLPNCKMIRGRSCVGRNKTMKCKENGEPSSLTCRPTPRMGLVWQ